MVGAAVLALFVAACGDDDDDAASDTTTADGNCGADHRRRGHRACDRRHRPPPTHPPRPRRPPPRHPPPPRSPSPPSTSTPTATARSSFGIAAAGPADDGAYYQAVVDAAKQISRRTASRTRSSSTTSRPPTPPPRWATSPSRASTSSSSAPPRSPSRCPQLIAAVPRHLLVLQLRRRLPGEPGPRPEHRRRRRDQLHRRLRDGPQAAGDGRRRRSSFIGCCDLGFEKQAYMAFELGLQGGRPVVHDARTCRPATSRSTSTTRPTPPPRCRPRSTTAPTPSTRTSAAPTGPSCRPPTRHGVDHDERRVVEGVRADRGARLRHRRQVRRRRLRQRRHGGDRRRQASRRATTKQFKVGVDPEPGAVICDADARAAGGDGRGLRARSPPASSPSEFGAIAAEAFAEG